jgi:hypothetical protein
MQEINVQNLGILAATILIAGCASSGDPRTGGIFWSETKAGERQQVLQQKSRLSWDQAEREEGENAQIRERRASLRSSVAEQRGRLANMHSDLSRLRESAHNADTISGLAELERKRTHLETSAAENPEQLEAQVSDLQAQVDHLKERERDRQQLKSEQ